jgi:hypothetical protein
MTPTSTKWLLLAERLYAALLFLYPAEYRREYGALMRQFFRDVTQEKYQQQGMIGVMLWWSKTLLDLILTVIEQHRKANDTMSKTTLTQMMSQLTGILLVIGGACGAIAAFSQLQPDDHFTFYGIYRVLSLLFAPSFLFIGLGCIGLALRYQQALGTLRQWTLYSMGIGTVVMAVGAIAMVVQASLWNMWFVGAVVHTLSLVIFGVWFAQKPFLPIFRFLPLQMAAGWLMMAGITDLFPQPIDNLLTFLMAFGLGMAWLAIGLKIRQTNDQSAHPTIFAQNSA